jgi:hypothetical protein
MQGFKTDETRNVRVETAAQVRLDFAMEIGAITEVIEVSANAVTLNTENPTVGGVIENKRIIDLPLNGRNVTQLAVLVPGVQFGERTGRGDGLGGFTIPGSGFSVSANGQREIHQVVSLDGVDAKDPRIHITNFVPSIEAIEEFKIQTNAYTAEYGFGGGANVQITMKSGTNARNAVRVPPQRCLRRRELLSELRKHRSTASEGQAAPQPVRGGGQRPDHQE